MNRKLLFFPAFDRTNPDPSKDYGVSCLELRFTVEGKDGMVEFQLLTQWYLPHVMERRLQSMKNDVLTGKADFILRHFWSGPTPIDLCYFSPVRLSEDDAEWRDGVSYVAFKPCYYGYKYMDENENIAKEVAYWLLVEKGDEALWKYLEEYYIEVFGENNGGH